MKSFNDYLFILIFCISFSNCFTLPTPSPGFGNGAIDLGGLLVYQIKNLNEPLPDGFFMLGSYSQSSHNDSPSGWYVAGKDTTNDPSRVILKSPIDYTIVKKVTSQEIKNYGGAYVWQPVPPKGYMAVGNIATGSPDKPPLDKIRCVLSDFVGIQEYRDYVWGVGNASSSDSFNLHSSLREEADGNHSSMPNMTTLDVPTRTSNMTSYVLYLKNVDGNPSSMPNMAQLDELIKKYSPVIYFHPNEQFFPSLVSYFFENGGLLYIKGNESNPVPIDPTGSNLPQGGSDDGLYWLDLPIDNAARSKVMVGDLVGAGAYIHVKPALGATCTDIAIWIYYPFNGPAKAKVEFFNNVDLGKVGEHVGDWEHVTLRISNFNSKLQSVYFSQHGKGVWVDAPGIEYQSGTTKPVVYSSLHGHAAYPKPGINLLGNGNVGVRNDAAKGDKFMDTRLNYKIISADYLKPPIVEPSWLNYARKWGPTINSDFSNDMGKATKILPGYLKKKFMNLFNNLPKELMAQEGPIGPKWKASWVGDENA